MGKTTKKEKIIRASLLGAGLLSLVIWAVVDRESLSEALARNFFQSGNYRKLLEGLGNTFLITAVAFLMGLVLGTLVCLVNESQSQNTLVLILKQLLKFYVLLFRGTPVVVQLLIIYFILFAAYSGPAVIIATLAFGLNSGAYVSEYIRGGIGAVPAGQMEAGLSLGLPYRTVMAKIILPQAYKNAFPSLGNEVIALIKETSVAGFIGALDLTQGFRQLANVTYDFTTVYLVMGATYFVIVMGLTALLSRLEKKVFKNAHA
jgi:His/Glu/Gln/Arg/opine family amino acid ABC transporter permease subunit